MSGFRTHFKDTHLQHVWQFSWRLASRLAGKYWLDIDHRRPINHLNGADSQPFLLHFPHDHSMKPQRIWPVRGSRRKYSCQYSLRVRTRMDFQNVTPPLVQPAHNEKFVSDGNSLETARREGIRFKPSVGRSFRTLLRRFFAILDRRSNDRDRTQLQPCASHRRFVPSASSFAPACHVRFPPGFSQALSLQLSLPPERPSRSHVSCTGSSQL